MKLSEVNSKLASVKDADQAIVLAGATQVKDAYAGISKLNPGDQFKWVGLNKTQAENAMGSRKDLVGTAMKPGRILGTELTDDDSKEKFWMLAVVRKGADDVRFYGGSRIHGDSSAAVMKSAMKDWVTLTAEVPVEDVPVEIKGEKVTLKQWLF